MPPLHRLLGLNTSAHNVVAHIATDGESLVTGGDHLLRRRLHSVFFEIRQNGVRACLRELRRRLAV
ncbi:MAG: hypothetical protein J2P49_03235 [Methylocapsa sp.]|nr:hypothetical protein [Methylocapsa sp.]